MRPTDSQPRILPGFDRRAWDGLATRSLLHGADWLAVMSSRIPGTVYTVVHAGRVGFLGAVVNRSDVYEAFDPHAILFRDPPVFEIAGADLRRQRLPQVDPGLIMPALVLAAPGYLGDPAGDAGGDPTKVVRACLAGVLDWCRAQGVKSLLCLYTQRDTAAIARAVRALGGSSFPLTTRWTLPVWWDSWEGYLSGFGSSRRHKIRRELRAAAAAGVTPARIDPREHLDAIVEGRCARLAGYGHEPDRAGERERLEHLLDAFGASLTGYGALRGTELVGSVLCAVHARTAHVLYAGTTPHGLRLPFTHFVASYYAPAQHAGREDLDRLDYGIDHGAAKAFRGCRPEVLHGHAVGLDPAAAERLATGARLLRDAWTPPGGHDPAGGSQRPRRAPSEARA